MSQRFALFLKHARRPVSAAIVALMISGVLFAFHVLLVHGGILQGWNLRDLLEVSPLAAAIFCWPFVPLDRASWIRRPGFLAYATVVLMLCTGKFMSEVLMEDRYRGVAFWFFMAIAQIAGVAAAVVARRCAREIIGGDERARRMGRAGSDWLWMADMATGRVEWDGGASPKFGYTAGQLAGTYEAWLACVHPDDFSRVTGSFAAAVLCRDTETWSEVYRFRRGDGSYVWVLDRCVFEHREGAACVAYGGLLDISDRIRLEDELRRLVAERNRELDAVTRSVTHDLRSPLFSIIGYADLLRDSGAVRAERHIGFLEQIVSAAQRMNGCIEDMLDSSRDGPPGKSCAEFDLDGLLTEIRAEFLLRVEAKGGRIVLPSVRRVRLGCSRTLLYRALSNLVGNAVKYSRPGVPPEIVIGVSARDGDFVLTVADNGIGIPESELPDVFELGMRGGGHAVSGHGVGLHSVKRAARQLGGDVSVVSESGSGSVFTFHFPTSMNPPGDTAALDI